MRTVHKSPILVRPLFVFSDLDGLPHKPTLRETGFEWARAVNLFDNPTHTRTAVNFAFQALVFLVFIYYLTRQFSVATFIFMLLGVFFLGTIYNTVWYHRYCSHSAFKFKNDALSLLFLWTNPLSFVFREESYAIPHRIHHQRTEKTGDPYGPHLGWLASFLAPELTQRLNTAISEREYDLLRRSIGHIGLKENSYQEFKRTGSIERVLSYAQRVVFSQLFWSFAILALGGWQFIMAWYASIFVITALIRDFNWRGHGGNFRWTKKTGWEFDSRSKALNQRFYGFLASEWHDNHHNYPMSANNGFLPGQIDVAFTVIRLLNRAKVVESYIDAIPQFRKDHLHRNPEEPV